LPFYHGIFSALFSLSTVRHRRGIASGAPFNKSRKKEEERKLNLWIKGQRLRVKEIRLRLALRPHSAEIKFEIEKIKKSTKKK
jgi:hypothetical protein